MSPKHRLFSFVLMMLCLLPGISRGATTGLSGFDLRLFRPPADASGFLNLYGSQALGRWQFGVGMISDTSQGMLTVASPVTGNPVKVVDEYFTSVIAGSIGLTNFFQAGLSIPTIYFEQGNNAFTGAEYSVASFGDLSLDMKATLMKDSVDAKGSGMRPGIALASVTTFPTGSTEDFTGYSNISQEVKLVIDKKIGPVYLVANGGYRMLERTRVADLDVDDLITYGAGFAWALPFGGLDLIAEADGATVLRNPQARTSPLEWLAGIRQRVAQGLSYEFAAGSGIGDGVGGGDFRIVGGLTFRSTPPERKLEQTLLTETIVFQKGRPKLDRKSRESVDRVVALLKKEEKTEVELTGDRDLMAEIAKALQDEGISRGRISENYPGISQVKERTVDIRVIQKSIW